MLSMRRMIRLILLWLFIGVALTYLGGWGGAGYEKWMQPNPRMGEFCRQPLDEEVVILWTQDDRTFEGLTLASLRRRETAAFLWQVVDVPPNVLFLMLNESDPRVPDDLNCSVLTQGWPCRSMIFWSMMAPAQQATERSSGTPIDVWNFTLLWRPLLPGFLINTVVYGSLAFVLFITRGALARQRRRRRGLCVRCGYRLRGLSRARVRVRSAACRSLTPRASPPPTPDRSASP
jgi:hypothetical protein